VVAIDQREHSQARIAAAPTEPPPTSAPPTGALNPDALNTDALSGRVSPTYVG
jgi:hypothetical protein